MRSAAHARGATISYTEFPDDDLQEWDLDGHIVVVPSEEDGERLVGAIAQGARFVVLGSDFPRFPLLPCVNANTREGVERAVKHLIEAGHRHIGLVGVMPEFPNYMREIEGYERAMLEAGLSVKGEYILHRTMDGAELVQEFARWHAACSEVTAVFAADYTSGLAVLSHARRARIHIPDDLSIVCMDELSVSGMLHVPLSTVRQPFVKLGELAVQKLFDIMDGKQLSGLQSLPCDMVLRESVATIRSSSSNSESLKRGNAHGIV